MSGFDDYSAYDGLGLADLVRTGQVRPEEILDAVIARIESLNPRLNAVVHTMYDEARRTIAAGLPTGAFAGVPFMLKDLSALYEGAPTTNGSRLFRRPRRRPRQRDHPSLPRRRCGRRRQDQHPGIRPERHHGAGHARSDPEPLGPWAQSGRFQRRGGGRGGVGHGADGARHRRRRVDPHSPPPPAACSA